MKEATKKQMPFIIAILIVGAIILTIIISILVGKLRQDWEGFAADMQKVCDSYSIEHFEPDEPEGIAWKVHVTPTTWAGMTIEQQKDYCSKIYILTQSHAWSHKIFNENTAPILGFYVNGTKVAEGSSGQITLY